MAQVLLVEDNENVLRNLEINLSFAGFDVITATDGEAAIQLLEQVSEYPHIIVSDINMPRMDGFTFYETVRERPEWIHIPFIFLTARDTEEDLNRGYGLGADDYIVKPFQAEKLLRVINSKLKRSEMLQAQLQADKDALEKAKRNLTQMVAHELRTPLVSINMVLEIISRQMGKLSPEQLEELMGSLGAGSRRLNRLVEQMVLHTQLEAGILDVSNVTSQGRAIPLIDLVQATIPIARKSTYHHSELKITVEAPETDIFVISDSRSLRHALVEVITNALNFSPPDGEVLIRIWTEADRVWVSVRDNGPGIASEKIAYVMEDFYQVDREKTEQQGIGLGLPLARRIIEAHHGNLLISSIPHQGTNVSISLPLAAAI